MFSARMLSKLIRPLSFLQGRPTPVRREIQHAKLCLEALEDRTLLDASVLSVTTPMPPDSTIGAGQVQQLSQQFLAMEQSMWNSLFQATQLVLNVAGNPSANLSTSLLSPSLSNLLNAASQNLPSLQSNQAIQAVDQLLGSLESATLNSLQAAGVLQNPTFNAGAGFINPFTFNPSNNVPIG